MRHMGRSWKRNAGIVCQREARYVMNFPDTARLTEIESQHERGRLPVIARLAKKKPGTNEANFPIPLA